MRSLLPFFDQLSVFSRRVLAELRLDPNGSPNGAAGFGARHDQLPSGIVIHYTAEPSFEGTARWLGGKQSDSSCHTIVAGEKFAWAEEFSEDLPLVAELPATVVQLRPPNKGAWHATWANEWALGIELCSTGRIKLGGKSGWLSWQDNWTKAYTPRRRVIQRGSLYFEAYADEQVDACEQLCGWYARQVRAWGGTIEPVRVLGHEHVQGVFTHGCGGHDKRDPGPFDIERMRWAAYRMGPGSDIDQLASPFIVNISAQELQAPLSRQSVRRLLHILGYETGELPRDMMADPTTQSIRIFQRMMGLAEDGMCGPLTQQALVDRYLDRYGLPPQA